jgi:glutamyl-tRNA synthetase
MKVRTRFAPSPTGFLHVGGLRTALYNYLYAKQNKGDFILRIEDTDQNRLIDSATSNLIDILHTLSLDHDFGPNKNDENGPYVQSERLSIYKHYYLQLIKSNNAYACFIDNDEINPEHDLNQAIERMHKEKFVIKLKVKKNQILEAEDLIRGNIKFDLNLIEDPIIIKSDGYPTYHFANVIDDHLMKITHVIRGEEWISSLPKHIVLYNSFNWETPRFCHLPLLLNTDKSKLSKRQGDVSVQEFLKNGFLKETLINFVALLGWHPTDDQEIFSIDQLIQSFSIDKINKSGAIFDREKLSWMNKEYIKKISDIKFQAIVESKLKENNIINSNININLVSIFCKDRVNQLSQIWDTISCFYNTPKIDYNELNKFDYKVLFKQWRNDLIAINEINEDNINLITANSKKTLNIFGKNLFFPLRMVLTGTPHGADLFTIINIIGVEEAIRRIEIE